MRLRHIDSLSLHRHGSSQTAPLQWEEMDDLLIMHTGLTSALLTFLLKNCFHSGQGRWQLARAVNQHEVQRAHRLTEMNTPVLGSEVRSQIYVSALVSSSPILKLGLGSSPSLTSPCSKSKNCLSAISFYYFVLSCYCSVVWVGEITTWD